MPHKMRYRLGLELGPNSLGWAMIRLDTENTPIAVIKTGVRIFPDGRNPKDGTDLAVARNEIRAMRRRRDRLLKRKARMLATLAEYGLFPTEKEERRALERLDPYTLRAKGLDEALTPYELGRAIFHLNQRRGFRSNRRTDRKGNDSGALKSAIAHLRTLLNASACRTVGEWLHLRSKSGQPVRARLRQQRIERVDGTTGIMKRYDLYIDRAMVEEEFDRLWEKQAVFHPALCTEAACADLKDVLLHQRPLKPSRPGRCTLLPEEPRASMALPTLQRIRMHQEVNALRISGPDMREKALSLAQRDLLIEALERNAKRTIPQIRKLLDLDRTTLISLEDGKRTELKGNATSAVLARPEHFGSRWFEFEASQQDAIVLQLVREENETRLVHWLQENTGIDEARAEAIANTGLPDGYGALSLPAALRVLPKLHRTVCTYDAAITAAGLNRSSASNPPVPIAELPYYGQPLQRHVSFGTNHALDRDEIRFGRIADPSIHIALNQLRLIVNNLISRYGPPDEIHVEVARALKQGAEERRRETQRQTERKQQSERCRRIISAVQGIADDMVSTADIQRMLLWEELAANAGERCCPYSGELITPRMLFSDDVQIDHILPFSQTLDDSLNNKTLALVSVAKLKGNRAPWEAFGPGNSHGFDCEAMLARAERLPWNKRYRFAEDGYRRWLGDEENFITRALQDSRFMSRLVQEYLLHVCPETRVLPGRLTGLLRTRLGLNDLLSTRALDDHRHHAINACIAAVTDARLLRRLADTYAEAREVGRERFMRMPRPWDTFDTHIQRAIGAAVVSHKPDHSHERAMHNDTAYGLLRDGRVRFHKSVNGVRTRIVDNMTVIPIASEKAVDRHGQFPDGRPRPYKGYKGDSNYCIEIVCNSDGKWEGEVVSTFEAYRQARMHGAERLRHPRLSLSGKPLVMRLMKYDYVRLEIDGQTRLFQVSSVNAAGRLTLAEHFQANTDARNRDKDGDWRYTYKLAGSLQTARGRKVTVSPIGELRDPGFRARPQWSADRRLQKQNATPKIESGALL